MPARRHKDDVNAAPTMHRWTAKHYIFTAILVLVVMGMFVLRWS